MRDGFTRWTNKVPPAGVPLKIYCEVKGCLYSRIFTREEIEAWCAEDPMDDDPVDWSRVGWALTGIAKEMMSL